MEERVTELEVDVNVREACHVIVGLSVLNSQSFDIYALWKFIEELKEMVSW